MKSEIAQTIVAANVALIGECDLARIDEFFTSDYTVHFSEKGTATGHDVIAKTLGLLNDAFPQLEVNVEILVESDHRIAWMRTLSGIQKGGYKGFPASHQRITWRDMVTSEFRDGKIAQEWVITDLAEQLLRSKQR